MVHGEWATLASWQHRRRGPLFARFGLGFWGYLLGVFSRSITGGVIGDGFYGIIMGLDLMIGCWLSKFGGLENGRV